MYDELYQASCVLFENESARKSHSFYDGFDSKNNFLGDFHKLRLHVFFYLPR